MRGQGSNSKVSLGNPAPFSSLLLAREMRAERQRRLLEQYRLPILCLSIISPGWTKNSDLFKKVFYVAISEIDATFNRGISHIISRNITYSVSGPEAQYVIQSGHATDVKMAAIALEDNHPLGRLWDLDVLTPGMAVVSRETFGLPPRRCLVCSEEAQICGRNRTHSLDCLNTKIKQIVDLFDCESAR